jgi:arylsulfatase A
MLKKFTACVLVLIGLSSLTGANASPNFILILTDDHGWTSTSTLMDKHNPLSGSDYHETPNIDRLGISGMRFSQGYATAALCTPTRRSILFGQTQFRQGPDDGFEDRFDPYAKGYLTIPNMLKDANPRYQTAHFGKWHIQSGRYSPEDFGYDQSDGRTSNGDGSIWEYKEDKWKNTFITGDPKRTSRITDRGTNFIKRNVEAGNPFYLQLSYYATHVDIQTKQETYDRFSNKPRGRVHDHPGYAGMLADLDTGIGQILDQVEQSKISDKTYILLMADNGGVEFIPPSRNKLALPELNGRKQRNDPLRGGKWVLYEGGIRVPFFIKGPGIPANSQSDIPVVAYDILPTLASLAGYSKTMPEYVDGGSFAAVLNDGQGHVKRPADAIIHHRYASYLHSAIRVGDYKLMKFWNDNVNRKAGIELYNLSKDLGEINDLSETMPAKAIELETRLMDYIEQVDGNVTGKLE